MSSPDVWLDARAIIADGAAQAGLTVAWPNEPFDLPEPPAPFLAVDLRADGSEPMELGPGVWLEEGMIDVAVVIPTGSGITEGVALRKQAADWFRGLPPRAVLYDRFIFDAGGDDEEGNWHRLPLKIAYRFQSF
ncbi:phage tail terminator-like protein [Pseudoroseomonas ludipueritiae]|uniref:DUF3168 domain-containing protein n=1 Tax=Pseudoroseomonas ludipueritiae TaxID=198093 RepID=A0ABR7R4T2_9PROT|nr:phage tail terminator-like protein [Pseudoroseomonas ludipueritiae]MBC9176767.1 hypothetical protein [Pseudoroseomonas ludipueritiae]